MTVAHTLDDVSAHYVAFTHTVEEAHGGRWRYLVHAADHWVYRDGGEEEDTPTLYETGPKFDTREAADNAGHSAVSYYHYLNSAESAEGGEQ